MNQKVLTNRRKGKKHNEGYWEGDVLSTTLPENKAKTTAACTGEQKTETTTNKAVQ